MVAAMGVDWADENGDGVTAQTSKSNLRSMIGRVSQIGRGAHCCIAWTSGGIIYSEGVA